MRRPGRLDREIAIGMPTREQRAEILHLHSALMPLAADVDMEALAGVCHGYTGADLAALCREAAMTALSSGESNKHQRDVQSHKGRDAPPDRTLLHCRNRMVSSMATLLLMLIVCAPRATIEAAGSRAGV